MVARLRPSRHVEFGRRRYLRWTRFDKATGMI